MAEEINKEEINKVAVVKSGSRNWQYLIYFIGGVVEVFLLFRLVFKLTGADPASGFAGFIYGVTNFFVAPYAGFILEPGTLMAMAVYAVLAWVIVKIIRFVSGRGNGTT